MTREECLEKVDDDRRDGGAGSGGGRGPALAQSNDFLSNFFNRDRGIEQSVDQQSQSGDVTLGYSVTNSGDYASQCAPAIQFGNTGNFQNASSFLQYGSEADDFEPGGIEVTFAPQQGVDCSNEIQQSSAASSYGGW